MFMLLGWFISGVCAVALQGFVSLLLVAGLGVLLLAWLAIGCWWFTRLVCYLGRLVYLLEFSVLLF